LRWKAKIDTGAQSSSIDTKLAIELGYEDLLDYFASLEMPTDLPRANVKQIEEDLRNKYLVGHPDLEDIIIIYSSSGVTIRPKVKLEFDMDKERVISKVNIVERTGLKYPMIVGKRDLKKIFN